MGNDVDILIYLLPPGGVEGNAQPDYIVVRLSWDKCSEVICDEKANEVGMVFDKGEFPEFKDKMMDCWVQMTSVKLA